MIRVGVIGATGYAGQQLVWLLNKHTKTNIIFLTSYNYSDVSYDSIYRSYKGFLDNSCIDIHEAEEKLNSIDLLFIALPHGKSFDIVKKALALGVKVIDLGADYRLKSSSEYKEWYKLDHQYVDALSESVYGLPELYKEDIKDANLIANPGCYPTASILALAPLLKHGLIDASSIIIDAKSGVSGAGRSAKIANIFCECNESIKAYGIASHRHTPEIEQELSNIYGDNIALSFTPHLVPMNRGILATSYGSLSKDITNEDLITVYKDYYKDKRFVRVIDDVPETRWVKGTNLCDVTAKIDKRTNRVIAVSAIDNLMKGAASQAVQNMNIMFGLDESESLDLLAMAP